MQAFDVVDEPNVDCKFIGFKGDVIRLNLIL